MSANYHCESFSIAVNGRPIHFSLIGIHYGAI